MLLLAAGSSGHGFAVLVSVQYWFHCSTGLGYSCSVTQIREQIQLFQTAYILRFLSPEHFLDLVDRASRQAGHRGYITSQLLMSHNTKPGPNAVNRRATLLRALLCLQQHSALPPSLFFKCREFLLFILLLVLFSASTTLSQQKDRVYDVAILEAVPSDTVTERPCNNKPRFLFPFLFLLVSKSSDLLSTKT